MDMSSMFSHLSARVVKSGLVDARKSTDVVKKVEPDFETLDGQQGLTDAFARAFEAELAKCTPVPVSLKRRAGQLVFSADFSENTEHPLAFLPADIDLPITFGFEFGTSSDGHVMVKFESLGFVEGSLLEVNVEALSETSREVVDQLLERHHDDEWLAEHSDDMSEILFSDMFEDFAIALLREKLYQLLIVNYLGYHFNHLSA